MMNAISTDESLQILLLVCAPLTLLLLGAVVLFSRNRRNVASFPDFSLTISSVGREEAYVIYHSASEQLEFAAEIGKGSRFFTPRISVQMPSEISDHDARRIVPKLTLGLTKLRYEYVVFRRRQTESIPNEEREAATAELHQMGVDIDGWRQVSRAIIHNLPKASAEQTKATISKVQELLAKAQGDRERIEVLASSDSEAPTG